MTAPTRDPIRKLAEEIALWGAAGGFAPQTHSDHWEARIRSTLPSHAQLLGELAVKAALLQDLLAAYVCACRLDGDEDCDPETGHPLDPRYLAARSTLSSDSGRLAGEVLRAAVSVKQSAFNSEGQWSGNDYSGVVEELADKVDALLAAFPGLREEVER